MARITILGVSLTDLGDRPVSDELLRVTVCLARNHDSM